MKRISPTVESEFLHNRYGLTQEDKMGETENEKYVREQKEAAARAAAEAERIRAEEDAREADQQRIRNNQTN